jgi:hypothetical protein
MCVCVYVCPCICAYVYMCVRVYVCLCICVLVSVYMCVCVYVRMRICVSAYMCVCVYVCLCLCMRVYVWSVSGLLSWVKKQLPSAPANLSVKFANAWIPVASAHFSNQVSCVLCGNQVAKRPSQLPNDPTSCHFATLQTMLEALDSVFFRSGWDQDEIRIYFITFLNSERQIKMRSRWYQDEIRIYFITFFFTILERSSP